MFLFIYVLLKVLLSLDDWRLQRDLIKMHRIKWGVDRMSRICFLSRDWKSNLLEIRKGWEDSAGQAAAVFTEFLLLSLGINNWRYWFNCNWWEDWREDKTNVLTQRVLYSGIDGSWRQNPDHMWKMLITGHAILDSTTKQEAQCGTNSITLFQLV